MRAKPRRKAAVPRKPRLSPERENPYLVRPHPGKPHPENPDLENPALLITHGIKPLNPINGPSPPPRWKVEARGEGGFEPYRRGEFPEEFERLCAMSIKPVASLRFKRSCLAAWEKRVAEGYLPAQIADAYGAYAESYRGRNGEDGRLAKNLARWLEGDDGMPVWSDDPIPPDALGCDGEPLDMEGLAKADPGFAKLWRRVASRRNVILSLLYDRNPAASREEFEAECEADETLARHMAACEERYGRYLALCDSMEGGTAAGRRVAS